MPKIIPPENKHQVIVNHFLGLTRDENAQKTGLSTGTVTGVLTNFSKEMGEVNFETLTRYVRILRENEMDIKDSIEGFHALGQLKKLGVKQDEMNDFVTEVYLPYQDSNLTPSELIQSVKILSDIKESTNIQPAELKEYYYELLNKKQVLENEINSLKEQAVQAKKDTEATLKQKKVTVDQLDTFEHMRHELEEKGVSLEALARLVKMLKGAEKCGYSHATLIERIQEQASYDTRIAEARKELDKINKNVLGEKDKHNSINQDIVSAEQNIKKLESKVRTLQNQERELKTAIKTTTNFSLNQIEKAKTKATDSMSSIQVAHQNYLDKFKKELIDIIVKAAKKEQDEMKGITTTLDKFIAETMVLAEKTGNLKALAPFHKILDSKGEPHEVYPAMVTILDRFKIWCQKQKIKSFRFTNVIDELISLVKKEMTDAI